MGWDDLRKELGAVGDVASVVFPVWGAAAAAERYQEGQANRRRDAASARQSAKEQYQTAFDQQEGKLLQAENQWSDQIRGIEQESRGALGDYRSRRDLHNVAADRTRQGLMEEEANILREGASNIGGIMKGYENEATNLRNEAEAQGRDNRMVYTNTIRPNMMNNLENARQYRQQVANQAMSLSDYMNPNNQVAAGTRQLYGDLGAQQMSRYGEEAGRVGQEYRTAMGEERAGLESLMGRGTQGFESEIQGTRQRGLADVGTLKALGAQSAGLMGSSMGGPMTGGQMASLMGQQGAAASEAYATTQRRMRDLADQRRAYEMGMMGRMADSEADLRRAGLAGSQALRAQGLSERGILEAEGLRAGEAASDKAYEAGERARNTAESRLAARVADLMAGEESQARTQSGFRAEREGLSGAIREAQERAERERSGAEERIFGRKSSVEEGKIQRQYRDLMENLGLTQQDLAIRSATANRERGTSTARAVREYEQAAKMAGYDVDSAMLQQQMRDAHEARNTGILTGLATGGMQAAGTAAAAYFGGPAAAGAVKGATGGPGGPGGPSDPSAPQNNRFWDNYGFGQPMNGGYGNYGFSANPYDYRRSAYGAPTA